MKVCSNKERCVHPNGPLLPLSEFSSSRAQCKPCWAAYMRDYTQRHHEKINEQRRARRASNRDAILTREKRWRAANHDRVLEYKKHDREKRPEQYARWKREWEERNVDKVRARKQAIYRLNKDEINARLRAFRKANPERYRQKQNASKQRRRARLAQVYHEPVDPNAIYERDGGICGICGKPVERSAMSLDHIIPVSLGGPHAPHNLRLTHVRCNKARGNRGAGQLKLPL